MGRVPLVHPGAAVPQWFGPGDAWASRVPAGGRNLSNILTFFIFLLDIS